MVHGDMHRSLVLIVEDSEAYSYGVVLNRVTQDFTVRGGVSALRLDGFCGGFGVGRVGGGGRELGRKGVQQGQGTLGRLPYSRKEGRTVKMTPGVKL